MTEALTTRAPQSLAEIERVLGIDERADAAQLLHLGHDLKRQRR